LQIGGITNIILKNIAKTKIATLITIARIKIATTKIITNILEAARIIINAKIRIVIKRTTTITIARTEIAMKSNTMIARFLFR
jgi:hypothetical protein